MAALRAAAPADAPLLVSIDQEGGLVQRVRAPATEWPPMLSVGAGGDPARTAAVGRALGDELAALGIGWDFAPVLDVHTNPANPVIGNRAFGSDARRGDRRTRWRSGAGCAARGWSAAASTSPGTATRAPIRTTSCRSSPTTSSGCAPSSWRRSRPRRAAGMEAIMTAHVMYPALDPDRPATLSRRIATDVLRGELGFRGVLVSDDLGMKAVADRYPIEELAVGAIAAGCDHLLIREPAARQQAAFEALVRAAESRSELRARVAESAARVAALKAACTVAMPAPGAMLPSLLGTPAHKALAASLRHGGAVGRVALAVSCGSTGPPRPRAAGEVRLRSGYSLTPTARPSPVGSTVALQRPLFASASCTARIALISPARSPRRLVGEVAEQEGVVERDDAARAQVVGRPGQVAG